MLPRDGGSIYVYRILKGRWRCHMRKYIHGLGNILIKRVTENFKIGKNLMKIEKQELKGWEMYDKGCKAYWNELKIKMRAKRKIL